MPSLHEVQYYLASLWQLGKGDARGLSAFDISDHGVMRSFWAIGWAVPAILIGWIFRRIEYVGAFPQGDSGSVFIAKMAIVEAVTWMTPILMLSVLSFVLQFRPLLRTLIVTRNWLTLPWVYLTYVVASPVTSISQSPMLSITVLLAIMSLMLVIEWRILRTIMGGSIWWRASTLGLVVVSEVIIVSWVERILGVYVA